MTSSEAVCEEVDAGEAVDGVWGVDEVPFSGEALISERAARSVGSDPWPGVGRSSPF